jgi:release factor glutamine methyltransferase
MTQSQGQQVWTILSILNWATEYFSSKGITSARLDAQLLLGSVLSLSKVELYTAFDKPLTKEELAKFKQLILRRANREPLAYILGSRGFWRYDFEVTPAVLIPRADSEIIVERALEILKENAWSSPQVLDIGTGSGCLAISIALDYREAKVTAVDLSKEALVIAKKNAEKLKASVQFIQSDLMAALKGKTFQMIISNPPYISENELKAVQPEVREFEPHSALFSANIGMSHYENILKNAGQYLSEDGVLMLEIGDFREKALLELAKNYFINSNVSRDLNGSPRLLELTGIKK